MVVVCVLVLGGELEVGLCVVRLRGFCVMFDSLMLCLGFDVFLVGCVWVVGCC